MTEVIEFSGGKESMKLAFMFKDKKPQEEEHFMKEVKMMRFKSLEAMIMYLLYSYTGLKSDKEFDFRIFFNGDAGILRQSTRYMRFK